MRVIVARSVRLEAALLRFDAWWSARSRRERVLLGILAALAGLFVAVQLVARPILAARADAFADIRQFETLNARIRAAGRLSATTVTAPLAPDAAVTGAAQRASIVATTQATPGGVRATVADAPYDAVIAWIADATRSGALGIRSASITRRQTPGRVAATVEFAR